MKNWKRLLAWAVPLILILSLVIWAQTTNLTNLDLSGTLAVTGASTLTGAVTASTAPITCGSYPVVKTMTFLLDSLGYDANHLIFTLERGITVLRGDIFCKTAVAEESCSVILSTTGYTFRINVLTSASSGSQTGDVNFAAASVCTLSTSDFTSGVNGTWAQVFLQYTDY